MASMLYYHHQLHLFTCLKLAQVERLLLAGDKERAREILRFVRNARIVEILKPSSGELNIDAFRLDCQLTDLESQCHPMAFPPCPTDHLARIQHQLDLIAGLLVAHLGEPRKEIVSQGGGLFIQKPESGAAIRAN